MNKISKLIVFISLPILVIIFAWYFMSFRTGSKQSEKTSMTDESRKDSCLYLNDEANREECYRDFQKAFAATSSDACSRMKDGTDREICVQAKKVESVAKGGDLSGCDEFTGVYKDGCINQAAFSIAVLKKDPTWCDKITNQDIRKQCTGVVNSIGSPGEKK